MATQPKRNQLGPAHDPLGSARGVDVGAGLALGVDGLSAIVVAQVAVGSPLL